jgi:hypothetical protein
MSQGALGRCWRSVGRSIDTVVHRTSRLMSKEWCTSRSRILEASAHATPGYSLRVSAETWLAGVMVWLRVPHPPAGATTLIVSLGLITSIPKLVVLMLGVLLLVIQGSRSTGWRVCPIRSGRRGPPQRRRARCRRRSAPVSRTRAPLEGSRSRMTHDSCANLEIDYHLFGFGVGAWRRI